MQLPSTGSSQYVSLKFAFGLNSNIKNNLYYQDEEKIIYPAGYNVVQYNIVDKTQVYYQGVVDYRGISCIELSPLRRWLAVGLKGLKFEDRLDQPGIAIYDTITQRKKYVLTFQEERIKYWVSLAFPAAQQESKYLVSLSGNYLSERTKENEYREKQTVSAASAALNAEKQEGEIIACFWSLAGSGKILAWIPLSQSSIEAFEVGINQFDINLFTCIGKKVFKCFKFIEENPEEGSDRATSSLIKLQNGVMVNAPGDLSQDYTCHAWLSCQDVLIVCTANGEVILCNENAQFVQVLANSPKMVSKAPHRIECMCIYTKGFILGGKDCSIFVYKTTHNATNPFELTHKFAFTDLKDLIVTGISIAPHTEEKLSCTLSNNMIYTVKLKRDGLYASDEEPIEQLSLAFHSGPINGMDICVRKPLIATCGKDKTIKVWNYEEKTLEVSWQFNEEAFCIALHPSGLHLVVCLNDKLRWMNVSLHSAANSNKNKYYKEISQFKQCREIRFSHGGEYFAAINGTSSMQLIQIFRFYTGEQPPSLIFKGHTGRVKNLVWSKDDSLLASCGVDGMVYVWRIDQDSVDPRVYESSQKGVSLSCVALNMDQQLIYACGSDKYLYQGNIFDQSLPTKKINQELSLSQIAFTSTNKILFAGISDELKSAGNIRCILSMTSTTNKNYDYPGHDEQGIEKLRITADDRYVITAGRDGCVLMFEIKDRDARGMRMKEGYDKFSSEILVTRQDLEDLKNTIENFQSLIGEFGNQTLNNQTNSKDEQIRQLQEKLGKSVDHNRHHYELMQDKRKDIEKKFEDEIKLMKEKFETDIQELDTSYQRKVMDEVEKFESMKKIHDTQRNKNHRERMQKSGSNQNELGELDDEFSGRLNEEREQRERVQRDIAKMERDNEEIYRQIEQETKEEVTTLENKNLQYEAGVKEKHKKAKSDVAITSKKIEQKQRDSEQYEEQNRLHVKQLRKLREENDVLLSEITQQREIISERDKTIGKQEKQIYKQKKKSQNLEKFKFVLDHKIKELKRDIVPREDEITRMKDETNQMDQMLKKYNSYNNHLGNAVDELYTSQEFMNGQIKSQRNKISFTNHRIRRFKDDLHKTVQFIQDFEKLVVHVEEMKSVYASANVERAKNDENIQQEYENQKAHLKYKVHRLKKYLKQDNQIHKDYNLGLMSNNVNLIKEINVLRKQIKDIQKGEGSSSNSTGVSGLPPERSYSAPNKRSRTKSTDKAGKLEEAEYEVQEKEKILMAQTEVLSELRVALEELQDENRALLSGQDY